jgi:hypothetical protein
LRAFALTKAIVHDERFKNLPARAQVALLTGVIEYADRSGHWFVKAETLAQRLGRSERRVRSALLECSASSVLRLTRRRRDDGTLSVYDYRLAEEIIAAADELERLWTTSHQTKSSGGRSPADESARSTSADEIVRWPGADESVRTERLLTASNGGIANTPKAQEVSASDPVYIDHCLECGAEVLSTVVSSRGHCATCEEERP